MYFIKNNFVTVKCARIQRPCVVFLMSNKLGTSDESRTKGNSSKYSRFVHNSFLLGVQESIRYRSLSQVETRQIKVTNISQNALMAFAFAVLIAKISPVNWAISSNTAHNQTPPPQKTCDAPVIYNCNLNQVDSRVGEAINTLERVYGQLSYARNGSFCNR